MGKKLEWTLEYHGKDPKCTLDGVDYHEGDTFKTPSFERVGFLTRKKGWTIIDAPVFDEEKPPEQAQVWTLILTADRPKYTFEGVDYHQGDRLTVYRWTDVCILRKGGWTLHSTGPEETGMDQSPANSALEPVADPELDVDEESEADAPGITENTTWLEETKGGTVKAKRRYTRHA